MKPAITGLGSVSAFGPVQGLVGASQAPTSFRVQPFQPSDVVPGLKTRRLDRLSVWALVSAALAMRDAGIDLDTVDRGRVAVVCGTGLGCLELTEAALASVLKNAGGKCDPVIFPETLSNAPGSHLARAFGIAGPNVTVSAKGISGETALALAASLLTGGEADMAIVVAGDVLTRTLWEWHETAGTIRRGYVPGEGCGALVLETGGTKKIYARYGASGFSRDPGASSIGWGNSPQAANEAIAAALGNHAMPSLVVGAGHFDAAAWTGEFDGCAIVRLAIALARPEAAAGGLLYLGASAGGDRAAILLERA